MARWLGGVSISPSQQQQGVGSLSIDKIKQLLPSVATAGGGVGSASPRAHPSVALSHFAPSSAFPSADSSATSLLNDAATATDSAARALASSASAASSSSAVAVPAAVLASSLPETAPLVLSRTQKLLYFFGSVVLRYGWTKLNHRMTMEGTLNSDPRTNEESYEQLPQSVAAVVRLNCFRTCSRVSVYCFGCVALRCVAFVRLGRLSGWRLAPSRLRAVSSYRAHLSGAQHFQFHRILAQRTVSGNSNNSKHNSSSRSATLLRVGFQRCWTVIPFVFHLVHCS